MILRIREKECIKPIGTLEMQNGIVVDAEVYDKKSGYNPLHGMIGFSEKSVVEYARKCGWVIQQEKQND